jgi:hypothetical protein
VRAHGAQRCTSRRAASNVPEEAWGSAGRAASTAAAAAAAASGAVPSTALSMSSMLLCSAGCGDVASAMAQARECGEYCDLATRLSTVQPKKTTRMDLNEHDHGGHKSMIDRILCLK